MLAILAPILVFGLVIFVHELGHFMAAKAVGVYAPRFSIGFGPALFRKRWGETEYILAILPLGGYVRMASRLDEEGAFLEGGTERAPVATDREYDQHAMIPFGPLPIPEHRLFESKSLPARLLILFAGVTMNVVLAFIIGIGLALHFGRAVTPSHVVGQIRPLPNAPALAQLHSGDTLLAVNGRAVHTWQDVERAIGFSSDSVVFRTTRGSVAVPVGSSGAPAPEDLIAAIDVRRSAVLDTVLDSGRAYAAGLRSGDTVVAIDGKPVRAWDQLVSVVTQSPEQRLRFTVERGGKTQDFDVVPKATLDTLPFGHETRTIGKIGAGPPSETLREPLGFGAAVTAGARTTWIMGGAIVNIVKDLFTRRLSVRQLSGPVGITRMSVEAARSGLESLFTLIALLSVNVAILNLLPIPVLDGGQILINVLESVKGKPFSLKTREYILRFGLLAIALLFVVVMYNDTRGWFIRLADWVTRLRG